MKEEVSILIVEDEETVLQSLYNIISRRYAEVFMAANAQRALQIFETNDIDLVLSDIRMTGMDGLTMLRKMKIMKPDIRRLVMSAYSESEYFLHAIDVGVDGYIVKPFLKEKVLELIEKSVKNILIERVAERSKMQLAISEQQLRESNEAKDRFFSIIGHDVKTPVSTIASYASLLVDDFDEMPRTELLEVMKIIQRSSLKALDLLKNLLEWAKVQTGSISNTPEVINICDIVKEEFDFALSQYEKKKIQVNYSPKKNNLVYADKNMVQTVFRNLLSNAIKFTPEKGEIKVLSQRIKTDKEYIKISIQDTGVGIPPKVLANLFTIKENFSSTGTQGEEGTGMGLLFCKEFIDLQGGKIEASSVLGKGSTFSFSLPVAESFLKNE